uniref:Ribosomal RNA-processing protein 14/surfeit locus protein 6 C-terminal domain-containing protein n=1 Tax=Panagrellus redivivus TaxID=6233 RepID=A0A7E4ZSC6_PANRE
MGNKQNSAKRKSEIAKGKRARKAARLAANPPKPRPLPKKKQPRSVPPPVKEKTEEEITAAKERALKLSVARAKARLASFQKKAAKAKRMRELRQQRQEEAGPMVLRERPPSKRVLRSSTRSEE